MDQQRQLVWRKPSRSGSNGGGCVEVALPGARALVRDTKDRQGGTLTVPFTAWQAFTAHLHER
ncbi:DUF397 domain-containing protein [Haloechinothrix sp. YIM 98757]|uniref:DUF397 domain-containing protein n=1 Tax=Haloechinothrix aidingensis TaxID=2752311 RepID=A0A838AEN9_9PSEU|nr:DUF397 domain-containing protein [Haloechinothrix aidingensis]MBA0127670.1 DUF397 domain-containing protein [Haloechinothrix aidingensis]